MATPPASQVRSIYRAILRELPHRPLSSPSPLGRRIRTVFFSSSHERETLSSTSKIREAEQFVQYVRAQRVYSTLLERYNPGMAMDDEERVRLSARRVGMDLPEGLRKERGQ
jgi:hypothetical protein